MNDSLTRVEAKQDELSLLNQRVVKHYNQLALLSETKQDHDKHLVDISHQRISLGKSVGEHLLSSKRDQAQVTDDTCILNFTYTQLDTRLASLEARFSALLDRLEKHPGSLLPVEPADVSASSSSDLHTS